MGKRRTRRVKYYPVEVVQKILSNELLLALVHILLNEPIPLPCGEIVKRLEKIFRKPFTTGHISALLRKLEKWGVTRPYRSPYNGHLLWSIAETKTVELLVETLRKRETEQLMKTIGIIS
ncbi:MAG: hypothetical protein DRO40_05820 [Thermoprotei archaeon]|nr:MAG: hypothetical protein DRO40_05820 [Thermoprotei archaeon]